MPDETGPTDTVRRYIDAFNKGDVKTMAALFNESGFILDGPAPHVWHGPTACQDWYRDALEAGDREGATDYFIALGEPSHADVTGDNGYVVVPRHHDIQSAWPANYADRRDLHSRARKDCGSVAHSSLGMG